MRAILYCRVSTTEQVQNLSLPTQRRECRAYCDRNGFTVVQEFIEEGESAKTTDRTQLKALLEYCRKNKGRVDVLVFYNISRLSRSTHDFAVLRALFLKLGITVRSVTEPVDDTSTGKMIAGLMSVMAQFDNDQKAERTTKGMQAALALGRWTYKAPLGYQNSRQRPGPSLLPDQALAPLVRLAFESVDSGKPIHEVLELVTVAGLRSREGRPLGAQSLGAMLRNPLYAGRIEVASWSVSGDGDFEPIVEPALFRRVVSRLNGASVEPVPYQRDRDDFPLRRFLRCAGCGRAVSGSVSRGRSGCYPYYHCPKCSGVRGRVPDVEQLFRERLNEVQLAPGYLRLFREVVLDAWQTEQARARSAAAILQQKAGWIRSRKPSSTSTRSTASPTSDSATSCERNWPWRR